MNDFNKLKETTPHQSGLLPVKLYFYPKVYRHWHDEYEFIFDYDATCNVDGEIYQLKKGQALFIQSGTCHSIITKNHERFTALVVSPKFLENTLDGFSWNKVNFNRLIKENSSIILHLQKIVELSQSKPFGYEFLLRATFLQIFSNMLENGAYTILDTPKVINQKVEDLFNFVHDHYSENLTLDDLSNYSFYSKTYIIRLFKKYTSLTPTEYLVQYRLNKAKELLRLTTLSVTEIAYNCGFDNIGYFNRAFKKRFLVTPSNYRKSTINN